MRDRLIELLRQIEFDYSEECVCAFEDGYKGTPDFAKFFVDHLLAEGVIVPPVKLGQSLFVLEDIGIQTLPEIVPLTVYNLAFTVFEEGIKSHIVCITKSRKVRHIKGEDLGETAFLTREEAERALEEKSKENDLA